jgi:hypothetical protein
MKNNKIVFSICLIFCLSTSAYAQKIFETIKFGQQTFQLHHVTGTVIKFKGENVLKIERDLVSLPFDSTHIESTVDEPHYAKLVGISDFENGTIEVKMYSQLQTPAPYSGIAGFIGVYFKIQKDDSAFEGIYVRPKVGRATNQLHRNHAVQYISYPNYKFDTLRKIAPFKYEGSAPVALHEWITMRLEINGETAEMFINNMKYSSFIIDKMLGKNKKGAIGLYVDIGTIGYFKDLKVTKGALQKNGKTGEKISSI